MKTRKGFGWVDRLGLVLLSALIVYMQAKVVEATYRIPVIEQILINLQAASAEETKERKLLETRVRILEEIQGHTLGSKP